MFRITIDNEEVLCDKDITIKEEMLNTPSVILNNVFPKSWEATKDYTTNFYHPDDYSKCIIADEDYIEQSDGTTVEGSNLSINYDDRRNFEYFLKGDTTQDGTPTPDTPVPIEVVTGEQDIQVCGKNLLNIQGIVKGRLDNGVIGYESNTTVLTLNENSFSFTTNAGYRGATSDYIPISENFTISYTNLNSEFSISVACYDRTKTFISNGTITGNSSNKYRNITVASGTKFVRVYFYLASSGSITITNPMLEKGNQASTYEAYKGNTYEINLGKNLLDLKDGTYTATDITATVSNGKITLNGTAGANRFVSITLNNKLNISSNETITVSTNNPVANNKIQFRINSGGQLDTILDTINKTKTINIGSYTDLLTTSITLRVASGATLTNYELTPMIERGSVATSYSLYKTPIELCKIGNYQDYIKRSSGKNLFDYSTNIIYNAFPNNSAMKIASDNSCNLAYIECKPNTTYTISRTNPISSRFAVATTETTPEINTALLSFNYNNTGTSITITTPSNAHYIVVRFIYNEVSNYETYAKTIQIEEGNSSSDYEPYGTGWYLCKNIEKVVLNGSETWSTNTGYSGYDRFATNTAITNRANNNLGYNNMFTQRTTQAHGAYEYLYFDSASQYIYIQILPSRLSGNTANDFKTWLSTHNTTVYYVLNTPTYIGIEDEELISQLESVRLWNGLNNITTSSPYLPAIMNLHYNFNEAYYYMNQLYFSGVVKNSGNISLNPREPHFQTLQILDFKTFLSEGETLDRVIYNKTILETIQEVIGVISGYGFVLGNVQIANPNDVIGAYSTENKTAYDIFNYIAEITQSKWTTRLVDENTVAIDFYDPSALPQGTPIEYNTTYFKDNLIDNMFYSYSSNDYRNKQIMTSKEVFANISTKETIISSGYGSNFLLEQPVGQVESITLNNVEMSFATKQDKELGYSADFYYSVGSDSIESDVNIPLGSSIVIQYIPIVSGRQVIANDNEISRISGATGRNGIITRYENRNDASTSTELQMIGQSYIKYKGSPEIKLTVETRSNLWKIGDRVQFNAPIPELATEYMVKSKKIQYIPTIDEIFYTFEMSSSFNSEQDINYFDNQRAKALGNIKEGSYISRNIDIENVANITFQNVSIEKINSTGDNKLNATLNSPIVQ